MKNCDLNKDLAILVEKSQKQTEISIKEILKILSGKGRPLILIFLSLPFCQPLQIPGLSTPFGLLIAFIGFRMIFGKQLWLPKILLSKTISSKIIQKISQKCIKILTKISHWIHPRFTWLFEHSIMRISNSLLIVLLGIFLSLPLPIPLTNLSAGWAIFLLSIGFLENDGVFLISAYLITLITAIILVLLTFSIQSVF